MIFFCGLLSHNLSFKLSSFWVNICGFPRINLGAFLQVNIGLGITRKFIMLVEGGGLKYIYWTEITNI